MLLVEKLWRQLPFEIVVPEIKVLATRPFEDHHREGADEAVVADIKLMHKYQSPEAPWDNAAEPVGVEVDESSISQEPHFDREMASNVGMVQVQTGHNGQFFIVKRRCTEDPFVGANIFTFPIDCEAKRVGEDGLLQGLKSNISVFEPVVFKFELGIHLNLIVFRKVTALWESQELAVSYEGDFSIG